MQGSVYFDSFHTTADSRKLFIIMDYSVYGANQFTLVDKDDKHQLK